MTRFKEYVRKKGVRLECDFECLPFNGIETVVVIPERAQVSEYHVSAGWCHIIIGRDGQLSTLYKNDDLYEADIAVFDRMEMRRIGL